MLHRNKNEKAVLNPIVLEIFIDLLFEKCKNEYEVEFLQRQLLTGNLAPKDLHLINN